MARCATAGGMRALRPLTVETVRRELRADANDGHRGLLLRPLDAHGIDFG